MAACELQADEREFVGKRKIPSKAVKETAPAGLEPPQRVCGIWIERDFSIQAAEEHFGRSSPTQDLE